MINSKELMEKCDISRATLNNYIGMGIIERPDVVSIVEGTSSIPRLGFFPDDTIKVIQEVKRLKADGMSMKEISNLFNAKRDISEKSETKDRDRTEQNSDHQLENIDSPPKNERTATKGFITNAPQNLAVEISLDNLPGPAFMVNNNFELTWWNNDAKDAFFDLDAVVDHEIEARNIFHMLLNRDQAQQQVHFPQLLSFTMSAAKKRMSRAGLAKVYPYLENEDVRVLSELYESTEAIDDEAEITHRIFDLQDQSGEGKTYTLYIVFFREGVFFAFQPGDSDSSSLVQLLAQRNHVIREIMKNRRPFLTDLVIMVADLQNSVQICAELPADEYFELINGIWQRAEPIFRKYNATHGKHVGDGMVYYFLPQPDSNYINNAISCALELRAMMSELTREWQKRKNWPHELKLNIGLNEGQEWFGTYHTGTQLEFTVLGDTINHAARLSDFARNGAVWATKNMISKMGRDERRKLRYGIMRETLNGEKLFAPDLYSRISALVDLDDGKNQKFHDISALPVAEIVDFLS